MSNANIQILTLTVAALAEAVSYGQFVGFDGGPAGVGEPVLGVAKHAAGIGQCLAVVNQGLTEVVGVVNIAAGDLVYSDAQGRPTTVGNSHPCGIALQGGPAGERIPVILK